MTELSPGQRRVAIRRELERPERGLRESVLPPADLEVVADRPAAWDPDDVEPLPLDEGVVAMSSPMPELLAKIRTLPELERMVVLGMFWGGMSMRGLAKVLGRDFRTIGAALERAKLKLALLERPGRRRRRSALTTG